MSQPRAGVADWKFGLAPSSFVGLSATAGIGWQVERECRTILKKLPYAPKGVNMGPLTAKLTIRLPKSDVDFAKAYAKAHGITVTEVIDRYFRRMRSLERRTPAPEIVAISGLVPSDVDAEEEYRKHLRDKHLP